ncbi:MAG: hypothetical protein AAF320_06295 [Myxococcota bacterium]
MARRLPRGGCSCHLLHVDYKYISEQQRKERNPWDEFFGKQNAWLLRAAPLMRVEVAGQDDTQQTSNHWSFLHASLQQCYRYYGCSAQNVKRIFV